MFKKLKWLIVLLLLSVLESHATFSVPDRPPEISPRISSPTSHPTFAHFAHFVVSSSSDPSGSVEAEYEYSPFGELTASSGAMADENPFRFSTKYWDIETGLGYWGMRYYHPEQGRWLSRDPLGEEGGLLLYGFVGNDPVGGVDLLGLMLGFEETTYVDKHRDTYRTASSAFGLKPEYVAAFVINEARPWYASDAISDFAELMPKDVLRSAGKVPPLGKLGVREPKGYGMANLYYEEHFLLSKWGTVDVTPKTLLLDSPEVPDHIKQAVRMIEKKDDYDKLMKRNDAFHIWVTAATIRAIANAIAKESREGTILRHCLAYSVEEAEARGCSWESEVSGGTVLNVLMYEMEHAQPTIAINQGYGYAPDEGFAGPSFDRALSDIRETGVFTGDSYWKMLSPTRTVYGVNPVHAVEFLFHSFMRE